MNATLNPDEAGRLMRPNHALQVLGMQPGVQVRDLNHSRVIGKAVREFMIPGTRSGKRACDPRKPRVNILSALHMLHRGRNCRLRLIEAAVSAARPPPSPRQASCGTS